MRPEPSEATKRALAGVRAALEGNAERERKKREHVPKAGAKPFTTKYGVKWCRAQGWTVKHTERWEKYHDGRRWTLRHYDLEGGSDVACWNGEHWIFLQAAGKGERAEHRRRFEERREQLAPYPNWLFIYAEFVRGDTEPVLLEVWD